MAVYLMVDIDVHDAPRYEQYKSEVPALVRKHGGEYLVRGGDHQVLEGDWRPVRLVLLRFPDRQSVTNFFSDPDYEPLKQLRHRAAKSDIVVVEGL